MAAKIEKTIYVTLERDEHAAAKELALQRGVNLPTLFAELVQQYADGPLPPAPKRATPQSQMNETRVAVPATTATKARLRAQREGRFLSDVVAEMLTDELRAS